MKVALSIKKIMFFSKKAPQLRGKKVTGKNVFTGYLIGYLSGIIAIKKKVFTRYLQGICPVFLF